MNQSYKNLEIEQKLKQDAENFQQKRAMNFLENHFAYKPKIVKFQKLIWGLFFLAVICNLISAATAFTFVHTLLGAVIHPQIAIGFALIILLAIEFCKHLSIYPLFFEWRVNRKLSVMHLGFVIVLMGASLFFSWNGGKAVIVNYSAPPELIDINNTKGYYDTQIATIRKDIGKWEKLSKSRPDNWRIDNVTIPDLQKRIAVLQDQRNKEVNTTSTSNLLAVEKSEKQISLNAATVSLIAVSCDALLIIMLGFILQLRYDGARELNLINVDQNLQTVSVPQRKQKHLNGTNTRMGGLKVLEMGVNPVITKTYPIQDGEQKQPSLHKTIRHKKDDGTFAWYKYKDVVHRIGIAEKRLQKAKDNGKQQSIATNQLQMDYWNTRLEEFFDDSIKNDSVKDTA